jgi:hypothetical protein
MAKIAKGLPLKKLLNDYARAMFKNYRGMLMMDQEEGQVKLE